MRGKVLFRDLCFVTTDFGVVVTDGNFQIR
jgi:hypothetical protein